MNRTRYRSDNSQSHSKSKKDGSTNKDKSLKSRISNSSKGAQPAIPVKIKGTKRKKSQFNPDHKNDTCYHCNKKGHRVSKYPDKNKLVIQSAVAAISIKNEKASSRPLKRNKSNLDK